MGRIDPSRAHSPWVLADNSLSPLEVLAIIGVVIWVGGLAWLVIADVINAATKRRRHAGPGHDPDRPSR